MNWLSEQVDSYYGWLRSKTHIPAEGNDGWNLISTPFLGLFNDTLEIYAKKQGNSITLSDDGKTLRDLKLMGVSFSHKTRKEMLEKVILNYGVTVTEKKEELIVQTQEAEFPQRKHDLLQAILEIGDLHVLAKHTVAKVFKEDVRVYLDEQEIVYTPQFISRGSIGIEFTFDFQVAYWKKEIVLKCFNGINRIFLSSFLFMWGDIRQTRQKLTGKEVLGLAFINDENTKIRTEFLSALESGGADYIEWQDRHAPENIAKLKDAA